MHVYVHYVYKVDVQICALRGLEIYLVGFDVVLHACTTERALIKYNRNEAIFCKDVFRIPPEFLKKKMMSCESLNVNLSYPFIRLFLQKLRKVQHRVTGT